MLSSILGAITAIATIITAIYGVFKYFQPTPESKKEDIDKSVQKEQEGFEKTGRPQ